MSRTLVRAVTAAAAAAALLAGTLVGAQTASAAGSPVTGLKANPVPPAKVSISWDAYTDFTPATYTVTLSPGSREQTVDGGDTNALFGDLSWGTTYTATVVANDGSGGHSPDATLSLPGVKLSGSLVRTNALRGSKVTIHGTLLDAKNKPMGGKTIHLQVALFPYKPPKYQDIRTATTAANGTYSVTVRANRNAIYRVLYDAANTPGGWDANMVLNVHVPISLGIPKSVAFGRQVRFHGSFDCPAGLVAGVPVRLQEKVNGHWRNRASTRVTSKGNYGIRYTPKSHVNHAWRVKSQAGESFGTSYSKARRLIVR